MRHLFVVDPLETLLVERDTTIALMREAERRGHAVATAGVSDLRIDPGGRAATRAAPTRLREGVPWYEAGPPASAELGDFDVVWMRKDPPFDLAYLYATHVLSLAPEGTLVVNDPAGLREVDEKLFALRFPEVCPETLVSRDLSELLAFRERLGGEMVLKPLGGAGGSGVFHLHPSDRNVHAILEMATAGGTRYQVAQRYLPEVRKGDKRVIVLEGEPIGAVLRVPRETESRANFHAGGTPARAAVDSRDREICARIGPALVELGIVFAGIDVIGGWLTEVNVTSPTGIREIERLDGVLLERQILDAVEKRRGR